MTPADDIGMKATFQRTMEFIVPLSCMAIGLFFLVIPAISNGNLPGNLLDSRYNHYVLEHLYLSMAGMTDSFVNMPILYPWTKTLFFSDAFLGNGFIYALYRLLNFSPEASFGYWYLTGFVINFINAFIVLRLFKLNMHAASIGAFLFTFCIPMLSEADHAQVLYRLYVPWAIFTLERFIETRDMRYIIGTGLLCSLQLLTSIYIGMLLFYFIIAYAFIALCRNFRINDRWWGLYSIIPKIPGSSSTRAVSILLIIATFIVAYCALVPYAEVNMLYGFRRPWALIVFLLPQWQSYFLADQSYIWASNLKIFDQLSFRASHQLFMGIIPLMAILYTVLAKNYIRKEKLAARMIFTIGLLVLFTLSYNYQSLYHITYHIPGLSALRNVGRIILVLAFPISYIVGRFIEHTGKSQLYLAILMSVFLIIETISVDLLKHSIAARFERIIKLEEKIRQPVNRDSILVVADHTDNWYARGIIQLDAMLLAQRKGIKTLNGYIANTPTGWKMMRSCKDISDVIRAGVDFRRSQGDANFNIDPSKLILVDFENCDVNNFKVSNHTGVSELTSCRQ